MCPARAWRHGDLARQCRTSDGIRPAGDRRLCELSLKDPLTGLANRRHFLSVLDREIDGVARSGEPALAADARYRPFQDHQRHARTLVGDKVLQAVAKLPVALHPADGFGRPVWRRGVCRGIAQLPGIGGRGGGRADPADRRVLDHPGGAAHERQGHHQHRRCVCTGVGALDGAPLWIERADNLLYQAKAEGRNRVCIDHQQAIAVSAEEKNLLFGHLALGEPAWLERVAVEPDAGETSGVKP
jgi:two-component system cell cycle response regulator